MHAPQDEHGQAQHQAVRNSLLDDAGTSARKKPVRQSILFNSRRLLVLGITIAVALGGIILLLDSPATEVVEKKNDIPTIEIKAPSQLTDSELVDSNDELMQQMSVDLPSGGWIQIADKKGRLSQQYRTAHLDPNPKGLPMGWLAMDQPEIQIMLSRGRIVTITGKELIANAPNRALESGSIEGDVVIAMYRSRRRLLKDKPSMLVTTPDASFDNFLGELRCNNEIHLQTLSEEMVGRRLTIHLNDLEDRIQDMRIDELDYIRLASIDTLMGGSEKSGKEAPLQDQGPTPEDPKTPKETKETQVAQLDQPSSSSENQDAPAPSAEEPADLGNAQFYIATLNDQVKIVQGQRLPQRTANGNRLDLIFSMESGLIGDSITATPPDQIMYAGASSPFLTKALQHQLLPPCSAINKRHHETSCFLQVKTTPSLHARGR